tara:strand:- start:53666 stop:55720 length:2055 start_codon:yes stop_codon:yes gene_type:complete
MGCIQDVEKRPYRSLIVVLSVLLFSLCIPAVQANLTESTDGGELFLSCIQDNECYLTPVASGEEVISDTVFASPAQTDSISFEFAMDPEQIELAMLPTLLKSLVIDLRFTGELSNANKPELEVSLILGSTVSTWNFEAEPLPSTAASSPYTLDDEELNLNGERLLWPGQTVRLRMTFVLDRPGTWELHLRGASSMTLDIPWSEDINARNSDEPSSDLEPRSTEFETIHYGALLENDRDCWSFEVDQHEVLNIYFEWESVPLEIQQSHGLPDLIQPSGRLSSAPDVIVKENDESTRITYRWRALPIGDYIFCIGGTAGKFQPYLWTGQLAFEGMGPTNPTEFDGEAFYPAGSALLGDEDESVSLSQSGFGILFVSFFGIIFFVIDSLRNSTSKLLRMGVFTPGVVLLLVGGIFHPMWALGDEVQTESEIQFDDLIDMRLQQLWDISYPGVPEQVLVTHSGSTWGMLDGDRLQLRLVVEEARPLPDGRWQLIVPELQELRLDQAIFSQVARGGVQTTDEGMLEQQTVQFILLAGRSLLLDLLMLEAMMIVDEKPTSSVFHIDFDMVNAPATGSVSVPAWGTRPTSVSVNDWVLLQRALFPEQISVSLCDCDLDLLDVRFIASTGFDMGDIPPYIDVENASGLIGYSTPVALLGIALCALASRTEYKRRNKAKALATTFFGKDSKWK